MQAKSVKVGEIELTPIFDGVLPCGLDRIPSAEDREAAARIVEPLPYDPFIMEVYAFILRGPDGVSLVDSGTGTLKGPETGRVQENLASMGAEPSAVKHIFMTHLHGDHFGGLVDRDGKAFFPNAEIVVTEPEAKFWLDTPLSDMPQRAQNAVATARAVVAPYRKSNRFRVIAKDGAWGGLTAIPTPGHTPGHTSWMIASKGQRALAWGDVVHVPAIHLVRPLTPFEYDLNAPLAGETRVRMLEMVSSEEILVAGSHFAAPALAYIRKQGDVYRLDPV